MVDRSYRAKRATACGRRTTVLKLHLRILGISALDVRRRRVTFMADHAVPERKRLAFSQIDALGWFWLLQEMVYAKRIGGE